MERHFQEPEKLKIVNEATVITEINQLAEDDSMAQSIAFGLSHQVSEMIKEHNCKNPNEMLPKTPSQIMEQFRTGNSVFMVTYDYGNGELSEGEPTVLYHGTTFPNFENGEEKILGMQVVEFGSAIAHPEFRGYGLGTLGADRRSYIAQEKWGPNVLCLSTNKQMITFLALRKGSGMVSASFWDLPYISYLTCTCENSSERCGYQSCEYRRQPADSTSEKLITISEGESMFGKIPCTLVISDLQIARGFEEKCRLLHSEMGEAFGNPLTPGMISPETMSRAGAFFGRISEISSKMTLT